ncbi:MAG TPA: undecaprenyl diphosphate synthase family protein [Methanothrix sp.]|nr:undecaprenyl diphosphate synthase family protein [Methanothrix sp.]HPJ83146.1 undecaprenyl diphosphate synthase family protein [Methanothrix sp.]HPR65747.1 undecaprenyl diphosphate synthase family protein [Methanothrix sp.]
MLNRVREKLLEKEIKRGEVPYCIAVVVSTGAIDNLWRRKVGDVANWCISLGVREMTLFSERVGPESFEAFEEMAKELSDLPANGSILFEDEEISFGKGGPLDLVISIGRGGKAEVTEAIRSVLEDVRSGVLDPEEIDEAAIEAKLRLQQRPDLMIRLGGKELSNFMIWQSAYSELYFIDRSWDRLEKVEFLRAVRDYQRRERRFGR